jgi:hypothetical protein
LVAGGCGDDGSGVTDAGPTMDAGPDPAELACMETAEPGTPIAATETRDMATTPLVAIGAEPYLVTLPASGTGYLRLETDEPEEIAILFFAGSGALTGIYDASGTALSITSAGAVSFCPSELPEHFDVDFETAGTYFLELTSAADVWLLVSGGEGHAHME